MEVADFDDRTHTLAQEPREARTITRSLTAAGGRTQSSGDSKALNPYVTQKIAITAPTNAPEARNTAVFCHKSKLPE